MVALVVGFVKVGSEQGREREMRQETHDQFSIMLKRHQVCLSYFSNQGFLEWMPPSWEIADLFLESDSITILILLLGILSGEGETLAA